MSVNNGVVSRLYRFKYVIALALVAVLVTAQASNVYSISPSTVATYNQFSFVTPPAYTVFTDGSTIYAKNGATGAIDYSGTTASTIIQNAINSLTAGRATKETVAIRGAFTITSSITIPSYTILDLGDSSFTRSGTGYYMFSATSVNDIEIRGGIIDSAATPGELYTTNEIQLVSVTNAVVEGVTVNNAAEDAVRIKGSSVNVQVIGSTFYNPNLHAVCVCDLSAVMHNIIISGNYVDGTLVYDALTITAQGSHTITIEGNTIQNVNGTAASSSAIHAEDSTGAIPSNINIVGNSIYHGKDGITSAMARPIVISGNTIRDVNRGIQLQNPSGAIISSNVIDLSQSTASHTNHAIYLYGLVGGVIGNNVIKGSSSFANVYGIYWDQTGGYTDNTITGNTFLRTLEAVHSAGNRNIYSNNNFRFTWHDGILVQPGSTTNSYTANLFYNSGQTTDATYFDINMNATGGSNTVVQTIKGNQFSGDQSNRVNYNINYISGSNMNSVIVEGNRFGGNRNGAIQGTAPAATYLVRNNLGYITENKGTGTINSGSTSAVVTHGLAYTPSAGECTVTWTENPTNDPGNWWLSSITSTQFTVNVRADPGASNLDFSWACRKV